MSDPKLHFPATLRNRQAILEVMQGWLSPQALSQAPYRVLEIAAGSGEHSLHLAPGLAKLQPELRWTSTDLKSEHLASIQAWQAESEATCFDPPCLLDVLHPEDSALSQDAHFDLLYCANMIHIAPWACTAGLFSVAEQHVQAGGHLMLYGPFMREGAHTSQSNADFSAGLRAQDPAWGVRELEKVESVAHDHGFTRCALASMPANNLSVLFKRE